MKEERKRLLGRAMACGFLLAALAGMFPTAACCEELPRDVLRLHVVANSDREEDQTVKLKVRDAVLAEAAGFCEGAENMEEACTALCVHLEAIRKAAERTMAEYGFSDSVSVQITDLYFPTREYGSYTLPAGTYRALKVTLGEGKGKNWWCVVFPALCLPAAEKDPGDVLSVLTDSERELVGNPGRYQIRFKAVELFEGLRDWLSGLW